MWLIRLGHEMYKQMLATLICHMWDNNQVVSFVLKFSLQFFFLWRQRLSKKSSFFLCNSSLMKTHYQPKPQHSLKINLYNSIIKNLRNLFITESQAFKYQFPTSKLTRFNFTHQGTPPITVYVPYNSVFWECKI